MEKFFYKNRRRYIEIEQESDKYNSLSMFKPKLKLGNLIENINYKLSLIELVKSKIDSRENVPLYLIIKMLVKFNYYYQRYIENAPHKNTKINKLYKAKKNDFISDNIGDNNPKEKSNNVNNYNKISDSKNPNNISDSDKNSNKKYISSELYPTVRNFGNIVPNIIFIKNIQEDGNCYLGQFHIF